MRILRFCAWLQDNKTMKMLYLSNMIRIFGKWIFKYENFRECI